MAPIAPEQHRWVFWTSMPKKLDPATAADYIPRECRSRCLTAAAPRGDAGRRVRAHGEQGEGGIRAVEPAKCIACPPLRRLEFLKRPRRGEDRVETGHLGRRIGPEVADAAVPPAELEVTIGSI